MGDILIVLIGGVVPILGMYIFLVPLDYFLTFVFLDDEATLLAQDLVSNGLASEVRGILYTSNAHLRYII